MDCAICGKQPGEWQCSVCGRLVCRAHARTVNGKVYCTEHAPQKPALKQLRTAIWTVAILLIGAGAITYIGEQFITAVPAVPFIQETLNMMKTTGMLVVTGLGAILAVLVIAYLALRR